MTDGAGGIVIAGRLPVLLLFLVFSAAVLLALHRAKKGRYSIRPIPALAAVEEAVGIAAETGRPAIYLTGLYDMNSVPTVASVSILARIARITARHQTRLVVPCCHSLTLNAATNAVRGALVAEGAADREELASVTYLTDEQWGFAAGVAGMIEREKPAACFYFGHFVSESLIYAETGSRVGAFQIAGTNEFSQIPFFFVACDRCLIGEELYAASAYLSGSDHERGSLAGLDICKAVIIGLILTGSLCETASAIGVPGLSGFRAFFEAAAAGR